MKKASLKRGLFHPDLVYFHGNSTTYGRVMVLVAVMQLLVSSDSTITEGSSAQAEESHVAVHVLRLRPDLAFENKKHVGAYGAAFIHDPARVVFQHLEPG
jgi:hypothetical protein